MRFRPAPCTSGTAGGRSLPTIVSLLASGTEIVSALGLRNRLVGRSHECDFPEDVATLPVLSAPKVDPAGSGGQIDQRVREIVRDGLSVYTVRVDELERLEPDLIITQDQCDVCAVSLEDVEQALCQLTSTKTKVCSLHPDNLEDVFKDIGNVAEMAGVPERGRRLVGSMKERLVHLEHRTREARRPRVAMIEWMEPVMIGGGWIPELVRIAGGEPVIVEGPETFKTVAWSDVAAARPDVVVIMPCGYDPAKSLAELDGGELSGMVRGLSATRSGQCYLADGNAYFNRSGPRLVDSAEMLAELLHPEIFPDTDSRFGHAFVRWPAES
jgi:iron complex transport system substrate-binding protein